MRKRRSQTVFKSSARGIWVARCLLVLVVGAAYANSFQGPFIFDDAPSIVENESIRDLSSWKVLLAPPSALTTTGRPVVNLSLAINYALGGLAVGGYHALNLALHLLVALVLFELVRRTLSLPALSDHFGAAATELAAIVALLWAIHPLQTESVTYVVQRAEAMVGLFYLLTLYCVLRGATAKRQRHWYAAAVGACALGMASKEVMVSAPLVAILFDRTFIAGSFRQSLRSRLRLWLGLAATWLLVPLLLATTRGRDGSAGFGLGLSSWEYARTQFGCILHYLRLAFWPSPLVLDYGRAVANDVSEIVPQAVLVLLLVGASIYGVVTRPKLGFLGAWFFLILAPTSSIVPLPGQTQAEHRMYLPLAALVTLVTLGGYRLSLRLSPRVRPVLEALLVVAVVALGVATHQRNEVYRSELAIWDDTIRHRPLNDRAYLTRGSVYWTKGEREAALRDYDRSIELNPDNPKAHLGRGNVRIDQGRYDDALKEYQRALELDPRLADAHAGRGEVFAHQGDVAGAIAEFKRAIALNPGLAQAHYELAEAYFATGAIDQAIEEYGRVTELRPDYANAYNSRGNAYDNKGQTDAALRDYDRAISLRPDFAEAYSNRCSAREVLGELDAAIADCEQAIRIRPNFAEAYTNLGNVLQRKGQYEAALENYDAAIRLKPDFTAAYQNRAIARFQSKAYDGAWADVHALQKLGGTPIPAFVEDLKKHSGRAE